MIWMVLLTAVIAMLIGKVFLRERPRRDGNALRPAPNTLPVLGNAIKFLQPRHVLFDWFVKCQRDYQDETLEISVPSLPPGVLISDPANVEFVLKNETAITKGDFFKERSWDLFGHGIINASGEMWKAQRKAGLKFFSGSNLEVMVDEVLPEVYSRTKEVLREAAREKKEVDMQKVLLDFTTSVVGQMAYDMDIDASSPFSQAFDYASDCIGLRFQNPFYKLTELLTGPKLRSSLIEVKRFGRQIVTNAKRRRGNIAFESLITNEEPVFGSLIDSLLETFSNPAIVADSALNFLSAGRDTTAQSLTWTTYALMRHPNVLEELRREITSLNTVNLKISDLQPSNIPYTMAVFYESLRLYPPVPFELKQCSVPVTLPDGTWLPKNAVVLWCIWAMNRSRTIWGSEDADEFRPSRWFGMDHQKDRMITKSAFEFAVFNGGPRACLGKKMAEVMAAWLIVRLFRDFEFQEILKHEGNDAPSGRGLKRERRSQNSLTLPMEGGLPCKVGIRGYDDDDNNNNNNNIPRQATVSDE